MNPNSPGGESLNPTISSPNQNLTNPISTCLFNYFNWFQVTLDREVGKLNVEKLQLKSLHWSWEEYLGENY